MISTSYVTTKPGPGDIFQEYSWTPDTSFAVLHHVQNPISIPGGFDLKNAAHAEIVISLANAHLGYEEMAFQINGNEWLPIRFPETVPAAKSPSLYFCQWFPCIAVPLAHIHEGTGNAILLRIAETMFDGSRTHPPFTCIYGITVRVYYDPAKKPHATAVMTAPRAFGELGDSVSLACVTQERGAKPVRIDYIGHYEGINHAGDGIYEQWQYELRRGKIVNHLGGGAPGEPVTWDASWIPGQKQPMRIAARVTDENGVISITEPVDGLHFERPYDVEFCKPYDVPEGFTSCQYGIWIHQGPRTAKFDILGDPARAMDARFALPCWNGPAGIGLAINDTILSESRPTGGEWRGNYNLFQMPLNPLSALKQGVNLLTAIPGFGRSSDIHWPGVQILIRYSRAKAATAATVPRKAPAGAAAPVPKATPDPLPSFTNSIGAKFVQIPAGEFMMGSPDTEPGRQPEETLHRVRITKPFHMAITAVTQEEYVKVAGPSRWTWFCSTGDGKDAVAGMDTSKFPIDRVSSDMARAYIDLLNALPEEIAAGRVYRLPTEAEWEYACRAGGATAFSWGDTVSSNEANFNGNWPYNCADKGPYVGRLAPVASYVPNAWGLYDMHGNVWEACSDFYDPGYYANSPVDDPTGPVSGDTRVIRGGSWLAFGVFCRSAARAADGPGNFVNFLGFRLVCETRTIHSSI